MAGGQSDLVAVGGVARRGGLGQLALGELALQGLAEGDPGVAAACKPHGLMDINPAGQGVPDAAADAGGRAAEGLDLGGVVVGLVFKHEQPVLLLSVHLRRDMDGTGVDLLALVQLGEQAPLFQHLCADGGDVHEGLGTGGGLLLSIDLHPGGKVALIGSFDGGVVDPDLVQMGGEGGVAAVIGPVGVHHPHLGDGGVPLLLVPEVGLEEFQVVQIHGQPQPVQQGGQTGLVHGGKAGYRVHVVGDGVFPHQGLRLLQRGLPAFHRVDEEGLDFVQILLRQPAPQQIQLSVGHQGPLHPGHKLDALGGGVRPLVELPRQSLHPKPGTRHAGHGIVLVVHHVHLGLGKDNVLGPPVDGGVDLLHVIPVQNFNRLEPGNPQLLPQLPAQALGFHVEALFFLGVAAVNTHGRYPPFLFHIPVFYLIKHISPHRRQA